MQATLDPSSARRLFTRLRSTPEKAKFIGDAALAQVHARFATGGASGGTPWPTSKTRLGKSPPLSGLQESYSVTVEDSTHVRVSSDSWIAGVHQTGKEIRPVKAKALYVPLTPLGEESYKAWKGRASVIRAVYAGLNTIYKPGLNPKQPYAPGAPVAKYGVDFLLLQKVTLPPRPQIPDSPAEQKELKSAITEILKNA
jgi:hypothetical protein